MLGSGRAAWSRGEQQGGLGPGIHLHMLGSGRAAWARESIRTCWGAAGRPGPGSPSAQGAAGRWGSRCVCQGRQHRGAEPSPSRAATWCTAGVVGGVAGHPLVSWGQTGLQGLWVQIRIGDWATVTEQGA